MTDEKRGQNQGTSTGDTGDTGDDGFSEAFDARMEDRDTTPVSAEGEQTGEGEAAGGESGGETGGESTDGEGEAGESGGESGGEGEASSESTAGESGGESAAPSSEQVTQGDGGTPADQGRPQEGFDPNTLAAMREAIFGGQGQGQGQSQNQEQEQQSQEQQVPKDWTEYLTEEEQKALQTYDNEWGEVSEAEKIRTNAMMRHQRDSILSEVNQALTPIVQHLQEQKTQSHFDQVRSVHSDFDDIRNGPLQQWVQGMSNAMMKKAAEDVLQQGTTQEVIDLVDMYKEQHGLKEGSQSGQSTGAAPSVPASSQAPAQPSSQQAGGGKGKGGQKPPKPKPNAEAASATAAVTTGSRGADPRGDDPDDFQAGFAATAND